MSQVWMVAVFDDQENTLTAVRALRAERREIEDVFMPYPVTEMPEALGLKHSRLGWVCFAGGILGGALMMFFQVWTSSVSWALNIGGRPDNSIPAFIPPGFEFAILLAALSIAAAVLWRTDLFPGKEAAFQALGVTNDKFAVLLCLDEADKGAVRATCTKCHAISVTETFERPT